MLTLSRSLRALVAAGVLAAACSDDGGDAPHEPGTTGGDSSGGTGGSGIGGTHAGGAPEDGGEAGAGTGNGAAAGAGAGGAAGTAGGAVGAAGGGGVAPHCDPSHVYVGDVTAQTDEELEVLRHYDVIRGNVTVTREVADLSALGCATRLEGTLTIGAYQLETLAGLERLERVDGGLALSEDCSTDRCSAPMALVDLSALANLESVGGSLVVSACFGLVDLTGLGALASVGGDLFVAGNAALASLDGLEGLRSIGGSLILDHECGYYSCRRVRLTSIAALSNVETIGGGVVVQRQLLPNLDGLGGVTELGGGVELTGNAALTNIEGLLGIREIPETLFVGGNPLLADLDGLRNVTTVLGDVTIAAFEFYDRFDDHVTLTNAALANVQGLANVTSIGGSLVLEDNDVLTSLQGLERVTSIGGNLRIARNPLLTDLDGLAALTSLDGTIEIRGCGSLTNVDGLDGLGGERSVNLSDNRALTSVRGLANVTGGNLFVAINRALTSLAGLENFRDGGIVSIDDLGITTLSGLENLRHADALYLTDNPLLTNLHALAAMESVGTFTVRNNATLPTCEAEWLLYDIGIGNVDGAIDIGGNDDAGVCP